MAAIFLQTLPFFLLIGLGYLAGRLRVFPEEATAYLTKFVFYFALSAMLFRFASNLPLAAFWDAQLAKAYLFGTALVYLVATAAGLFRRQGIATSAIEAQCAVIGNIGFLGLPMLTVLMGEAIVAPLMLILAIDLILFSSLVVVLITASRDGRMSPAIFGTIGLGLLRNPMIVSISLGFGWSALSLPTPAPIAEFLDLLAAAATPGALFAIGASLASKSAERLSVALWLSVCKLGLHPLFVAIGVLILFPTDTFAAGVAIASAAMPVAGNIFMIAQHYGVAPQRVSAAILISTGVSILTLTAVLTWVQGMVG